MTLGGRDSGRKRGTKGPDRLPAGEAAGAVNAQLGRIAVKGSGEYSKLVDEGDREHGEAFLYDGGAGEKDHGNGCRIQR